MDIWLKLMDNLGFGKKSGWGSRRPEILISAKEKELKAFYLDQDSRHSVFKSRKELVKEAKKYL